MQAFVYAIDRKSGPEWRVTLRPMIDAGYWARLYGRESLVWLEPILSFGQAQLLAGRLNVMQARPERVDQVKKAWRYVVKVTGTDPGLAEKVVMRSCLEWPAAIGYATKGGELASGLLTKGGQAWPPGSGIESYGELLRLLEGRQLLQEELSALLVDAGLLADDDIWDALQFAYLQGDIDWVGGVGIVSRTSHWGQKATFRCVRCGSGKEGLRATVCPDCGGSCLYCEACLTMGRARFCSLVVRGRSTAGQESRELGRTKLPARMIWAGEGVALQRWGLSPAQQKAASKALAFLNGPAGAGKWASLFLLWAVTGAGKTEMLFPLIAWARACGERVLLATPRRDVVLELLPRLKVAFPEETVIGLYGGSEERWRQADIVVATTHQTMRFCGAFGLVVIDEVDAFPYHNNPLLVHAAAQARTGSGRTVLLSATPPDAMRRAAERGRLAHAKVPVRFHGQPLPQPRLHLMPSLEQWVRKGLLPAKARQLANRSRERGAQLFVFVPRIRQIEPLLRLFRAAFPEAVVEGTSSTDGERAGKVTAFRENKIDILLTTTILERGVTVPKTDVLILDADCPLFDAAALIQMAGRAGRSASDPAGFVTFIGTTSTRAQKEAIHQIKQMNRIAVRQGFLQRKGDAEGLVQS